MNIIIAIVGILVIAGIAAFMLYRTQRLHAEVCAEEHLDEILAKVSVFKDTLHNNLYSDAAEKQDNEHSPNTTRRRVDQSKRQLVDHTSKKVILTYLISETPNEEVIHSFSMSWFNKKIPIKSATYIASVIIRSVHLQDFWNQELRLSLKKNQVFHFRAKLNQDQNQEYFSNPSLAWRELGDILDEIRDLSLDVVVERKQEAPKENKEEL